MSNNPGAICCCEDDIIVDPPEPPGDVTSCCPEFNDTMDIRIDFSSQKQKDFSSLTGDGCVFKTTKVLSQFAISATARWNLRENTIAVSGNLNFGGTYNCSWGCRDSDCDGDPCRFSSCPCTATETQFAFPNQDLQIEDQIRISVGVFRFNPKGYSEGDPRPPGACCDIPDNPTGRDCEWTSEIECDQLGGTWLGPFTSCRSCENETPDGIGHCCLPGYYIPGGPSGNGCVDNITEAECIAQGGNWAPGNCGGLPGSQSCKFDGLGFSKCEFGKPGQCYLGIRISWPDPDLEGSFTYQTDCAGAQNRPTEGQGAPDVEMPVQPDIEVFYEVLQYGEENYCRLGRRVTHALLLQPNSYKIGSTLDNGICFEDTDPYMVDEDFDPCDPPTDFQASCELVEESDDCGDGLDFERISEGWTINYEVEAEWG